MSSNYIRKLEVEGTSVTNSLRLEKPPRESSIERAKREFENAGFLILNQEEYAKRSIENITREFENAGFRIITRQDYERLTKTKGFWNKIVDELPRALLNLIVAFIIASCSLLYASSKLSFKEYLKSLVKDELSKSLPPSDNPQNYAGKVKRNSWLKGACR